MTERSERRRAHRVSGCNLVHYSARRPDGSFSYLGLGKALDLSVSGLRIETREELPEHVRVDVSVQLGDRVRRARARVVRARPLESGVFEHGLELLNVRFGYVCDVFARTPDAHASGVIVRREDLTDLMGRLRADARSGVLALSSAGERRQTFFLAFREGKIVAARGDAERGARVVSDALAITHGLANFWPHELRALASEHAFSVGRAFVNAIRGWREYGEAFAYCAA